MWPAGHGLDSPVVSESIGVFCDCALFIRLKIYNIIYFFEFVHQIIFFVINSNNIKLKKNVESYNQK